MSLHSPTVRRVARSVWSGPGGLWLGALFAAATVRAHDPFEITTTVRLDPTALVLDVTMARSTAMAIAAGVKEAPTFDPADFEKHRARFVARAAALFVIASAGTPLAPPRAEVTLGRELDVEFHLVYPRPATSALRLTATHLTALGSGYGNVLTVHGDHGTLLGQQLLSAESPSLDVALAAAPGASASSRNFALPAVAVVLALIGGGWLWRRQAPG